MCAYSSCLHLAIPSLCCSPSHVHFTSHEHYINSHNRKSVIRDSRYWIFYFIFRQPRTIQDQICFYTSHSFLFEKLTLQQSVFILCTSLFCLIVPFQSFLFVYSFRKPFFLLSIFKIVPWTNLNFLYLFLLP